MAFGPPGSLDASECPLNSNYTSAVSYSLEEVDIIFFGSNERTNRNPEREQANIVRTTRFTFFSWLPLSLLTQFTRIGNIYLLIISVLTLMPFSTKNAAAFISTFCLVLMLSCVKEAFEDFHRYKADKNVNHKSTHVFSYTSGSYEKRLWKDIGVGELIRLEQNEEVPCDILLLFTHDKNRVA